MGMRIVYVTSEFIDEGTSCPCDGGLARYLSKITQVMSARGHDVGVVVFGARSTHTVDWRGIDVHFLDKSYDYSKLQRLRMKVMPEAWRRAYESRTMAGKISREIRRMGAERKIDIIQYASHLGMGRCPEKAVPNCVRISSYAKLWQKNYGYSDPDEIRDETWQFRRARFMYGPSAAIAAYIRRDLGLKREIAVIETPFEPVADKPDEGLWRDLESSIGSDPYLLFFGSIGKLKGCDEIAACIHGILAKYPRLHLVLIGKVMPEEGSVTSMDRIRTAAAEHADRVHWLNRQPHSRLMPVLDHAKAVLLPSRIDNLPNTCIEAMSRSKVVIGSRGASFEQLIEDGANGILCEAGVPESIFRAVERLMDMSEEQLAEMGRAARARTDLMSMDVIIRQVEDYYRQVIVNWRRK